MSVITDCCSPYGSGRTLAKQLGQLADIDGADVDTSTTNHDVDMPVKDDVVTSDANDADRCVQ